MTDDLRVPPMFAWMFLTPGLVFLTASIIRLQIDGLTVLGVVFLTAGLAIAGVFTREFWVDEIGGDHPDALGSLDHLERDGTGTR